MWDEKMKLDLGCGLNKKKGYLGLDKYKFQGVDIVCDLEREKIPLNDNSVDMIHANHSLEHISNFDEVMSEISRVLKPNGVIEIYVPYFSFPTVNHPLHKCYFSYRSFDCFEGNVNMPLTYKFKIIERKLIFKKMFCFGYISEFIFNLNPLPWVYERMFLCYLIPARRLYFKLQVLK